MCIITRKKDNVVVSVSLIPGSCDQGSDYNIYFPYRGDLPMVGDVFIPEKDRDGCWVSND